MQEEIEKAAYDFARATESGDKVIVGVNRFEMAEPDPTDIFDFNPALERQQADRVRALRDRRDNAAVEKALDRLDEAARSEENLLYPMKDALQAYATLGEVSDVLRKTFGVFSPAR